MSYIPVAVVGPPLGGLKFTVFEGGLGGDKMAYEDTPGWWQGSTDSRLRNLEEDVRFLVAFKEDASREITVLKTKLVIFSAIAAALGAMIPGAVASLLGR